MISASAPGKLNLFFEVGPSRSDGYHPVVSLYQSLAIRQNVKVLQSDRWEVVTTGDLPKQQLDLVPKGEENLIVKAALALADYCDIAQPPKMRFETYKQVPVAAGLAGGSADAAAALLVLNAAWETGLSLEQLTSIGARVGADVPFSLLGGTAIGVDTGVELEAVEDYPTQHVVLLVSPHGLGTKEVFAAFDQLYPEGDLKVTTKELKDDLASKTLRLGKNSLLAPALQLRPELESYLSAISGASGFMTGSGPTIYFLTEELEQAVSWESQLREKGHFVIRTQTDNQGAKLN